MHKQITTRRTNRSEKGATAPTFQSIVLMALILIALAGWAIVRFVVPLFQDKQIPAVGPALSQDAQAAIAGVSAFYTIDYTESAEQWADRVCATTTDEGCIFAKGYFAVAVHATAEKYSVQTGCTVLPVELVDNDEAHMVRIWKMQVTLSNPWPAVEQTHTVYVAVEYDENLQEWRMQHVLFEQEAQKYVVNPTP
ncbi:MAG: hypothetical protein WC832_02115 [Anaerolineales bacterium]